MGYHDSATGMAPTSDAISAVTQGLLPGHPGMLGSDTTQAVLRLDTDTPSWKSMHRQMALSEGKGL